MRQDWHYLQTYRNKLPLELRHLGVPSGAFKMIFEPMVRRRKPCTHLAPKLTLPKNGPKRASTRATSPRSTIGCVQNDFYANGIFGANRAPVLHRNDISHDARDLAFSPGASKTSSEPVVCSAQTIHLSCTDTNSVSRRTKMRFLMTHVT
jgi:hypothetical protein